MMICDPSHICGKRDTIPAVVQKAIDLDYDGLIIESHIRPDEAWSDAKQQITPSQLESLLSSIIWRFENTDKADFQNALATLREQINQIDDELLQLLGRRMQVSENIGKFKKENNITILQTSRWNEILGKAMLQGKKFGLSTEFVTKYLEAIHLESIQHQNKVMNRRDG
jgi:chorismate mutase